MAILFARSKNLEKSWPFVPEALLKQLNDIDEVQVVNVERDQEDLVTRADLSAAKRCAGGDYHTCARSGYGSVEGTDYCK